MAPAAARLLRDVAAAERVAWDVVVIGGGIYGAMILLEATRRGLRALLVEKDDFGGGTSFNNLRIVHGGLRYLQSMDLPRFRESVAERRWFLRTFPDLVRPLPCLMPLYGGLKRNRALLRAALAANDFLSRRRNHDVAPAAALPDGRVLTAAETIERFPAVRRDKLAGAALWYDAAMHDCHRILIETLRWAATAGAEALNYVAAHGLVVADGNVVGVRARDVLAGRDLEFRSAVVVNAAGPDVDDVLAACGVRTPRLFEPSIAWNVLFDRPPLAGEAAVAVEPPGRGGQVWFAHTLAGRLYAGTGHAGRSQRAAPNSVSDDELDGMLVSLNRAVPGLELTRRDVAGVFAGQLPVVRAGSVSLSSSATIVDHREVGGPRGLMTVSGVKFTTARSTAARLVTRVRDLSAAGQRETGSVYPPRPQPTDFQLSDKNADSFPEQHELLRSLVKDESPQSLGDLLLRRAGLWDVPREAKKRAAAGCAAFGWDGARSELETERLNEEIESRFIVKNCR